MAELRQERQGRVLLLTIDDPATRNALTPEVYRGGREAMALAASDPSIGAVVLTGAGPSFCSGGNLAGIGARRASGEAGIRGGIEEPGLLARIFAEERPGAVVHLAAQAGVRHSIDNPRAYVQANLIGTFELLEAARAHPPRHMLLASTSSVYGANTEMPYRETDKADSQMSFYAATKKSNEAMAHSYAHLFGLPVTMFRFFTVYGPWGRPDMAPYLFTSAIFEGRPIKVFNHGDMKRDFTFVLDLVRAIRLLIDAVPGDKPAGEFDSLSPVAPFRVVNIGNGAPVQLMDFIAANTHRGYFQG